MVLKHCSADCRGKGWKNGTNEEAVVIAQAKMVAKKGVAEELERSGRAGSTGWRCGQPALGTGWGKSLRKVECDS